jgi:hypothetical protein
MTTKFDEFLKSNKIDPRRIQSVSQRIERLRPEDRQARLTKRNSKGKEGGAAAAPSEGEKPAKRRSGRPVTPRMLAAISAGKVISGAQKTRLLRAVNKILEQRKKDPVDLRALF